MEQLKLLNALRVHFGNDSRAADALGISRQAVSKIKAGGPADDSTIAKACALLSIDPAAPLCRHRAAFAADNATKAAWLDAARRLETTQPTKMPTSGGGSGRHPILDIINRPARDAHSDGNDARPCNTDYAHPGDTKSHEISLQGKAPATVDVSTLHSDSFPDLFGQVPITVADVVAWCASVPAYPHATSSPRWIQYVKGYAVVEKIARAKMAREFVSRIADAPAISENDLHHAANAIRLLNPAPFTAAPTDAARRVLQHNTASDATAAPRALDPSQPAPRRLRSKTTTTGTKRAATNHHDGSNVRPNQNAAAMATMKPTPRKNLSTLISATLPASNDAYNERRAAGITR
jgi:hypothetical protein